MEPTAAQAATPTPAPPTNTVQPVTPAVSPITPTAPTQPPQPIQPNIIPMNPPKKSFHILSFLIGVIVVTLILCAPIPYFVKPNSPCKPNANNCIFAGWKTNPAIIQSIITYASQMQIKSKTTPKTNTKVALPLPTPTADTTMGWKTHSNAKYSYEFKCPQTDMYSVEVSTGDGQKLPLYQDMCSEDKNQIHIAVYPLSHPAIATAGAIVKEYPSPLSQEKVVFRGVDQVYFSKILATFKFVDMKTTTPSAQATTSAQVIVTPPVNAPTNWKQQTFSKLGLIFYTAPNWQSSIQDFPDTKSSLIRFWQGATPDTATIQMEVKDTWESTGDAPYLAKNYSVAGIPAVKVDPPKKTEKTLDRYQTNVYFESKGKVYAFTCVHNWIAEQYQICDTMLQTLQFTQ